MRYQEPIYIQSDISAVRNKDILNVNMSSDICIFEAPSFTMSGASKIHCTGATGTTYVITTGTTIPLTFNFTANTDSFTANSATFKYEIYKYNDSANFFALPPVYKSETFGYPSFSGTNIINDNISVTPLLLDGEYLVKGYFNFNACTMFLNELGKTVDTISFRNGKEYGLYDKELDYYFIALTGADNPYLLQNGSNNAPANQLFQQVLFPEESQTVLTITQAYAGQFVLTLNGLVLAAYYDYTFTGNVVTLNAPAVSGDIITVIYTTVGGNNLINDNISIDTAILSGVTGNQGGEDVYYNTSSQKFEIYTTVQPAIGGSIIVMLNGATLANGVDYYQSTSNPKRIILEGFLVVGDLLTIVYFPFVSAVNALITNQPTISWLINTPPQAVNGFFSLEVSSASTFSSMYFSGATDYVIGQTIYSDTFTASGSVGTQLYYRVKNTKNFETFCGQIITDVGYSDTIPITIMTNSINSY